MGALRSILGNAFSKTAKAGWGAITGAGKNAANAGWRSAAGTMALNLGLHGGVGVAAAIATGNPGFIGMGFGVGAAAGAGGIFRGAAGFSRAPWAGRLLLGSVMGIGTGSPWAVPATAGAITLGHNIPEGMIRGTMEAPKFAGNLLRMPFQPGKALASMAKTSAPFGTPFMVGALAAGGWGASQLSKRSSQDTMAGYFPGGISYATPGQRVMGFNHLETAGLTLALHNNRRGGKRVM